MLNPIGDLPLGRAARKEHIEALKRLHAGANEDQRTVFDHLYSALNILDVKSQTLVAFNAFVLAVCGLILSPDIGRGGVTAGSAIGAVAIVVGAGFSFGSAFVLLTVIWVHWSPTSDLSHFEDHIDRLLRIRNWRTVIYRIAWMMSFIALAGLAVNLSISGDGRPNLRSVRSSSANAGSSLIGSRE